MKKFMSLALITLMLAVSLSFTAMAASDSADADATAPKVVFSQENWKNATEEQLATYFTPLGWGVSETKPEGHGTPAITYDTTNDMLLIDLTECTNITGVQMHIPGFDETKENWMSGYTVEYELVLVDMNHSNFGSNFIGPYYDNFPNVDYGAYFRWYPKGGDFKIVNWSGDNKVASDFSSNVKKAEGESLKFKVTQDDDGMLYFYYDLDDGNGWQLMYYYEANELHYHVGGWMMAFRQQDIYGIKNFSMYENIEVPDDGGDDNPDNPGGNENNNPGGNENNKPGENTDNNTNNNTNTDTNTNSGNDTTAVPAPEEKKGCGSSLTAASVVGIAATAVASLAFVGHSGKKKEN